MNRKAQHISEYMVVFEVFAVATVILVTSLGYLPDLGNGSMFRRSDQLLSIGPLGLLEHSFDECGGYRLKFRNNNDFPLTIKQVKIGNEIIFNSSLTFLSGDIHYIEGLMGKRKLGGENYELPISISYIDEEIGGTVKKKFDDPLYGDFVDFFYLGDKTYLNQRLLSSYCILDGFKNHVKGGKPLIVHNTMESILGGGYKALFFNGDDSYADAGIITDRDLKKFLIELVFKANYSDIEKGIFYKPNAFYLTVKGNQLKFGVFSDGNAKVVSSSFPKDKFIVVHLVYDGKIKLYVNGLLKQELPMSKFDGSNYNLYFGTFTPESQRNSYMSLVGFSFFADSFSDDVIKNRALNLLDIVKEKSYGKT